MKTQAYNPYLPAWEYIPDGEPHVFSNRVYVYGSHDKFNGHGFCLNDYVCYSAPVDDLCNWKYEGVIYKKTDDPQNKDGAASMFAPDVCCGADGRYYLYYVLSKSSIVSVAVCDTPAGKYEFYGYVRHADGTLLGERKGDMPQFDPAVLFEDGKTYLYTGFCRPDTTYDGSMVVVLKEDMLTISEEAKTVALSCYKSKGTDYEGHEFFEASSIRKVNEKYYFVYSSILYHELCYAISDSPTGDFKFMGTIVSACDVGIDSYKPKDMPVNMIGNNHGGMEYINGQWYIFYHRHTNNHHFSRQSCAEPIEIMSDGTIKQVKISSCGLNGKPLKGKGDYPTYIACRLFRMADGKLSDDIPFITMETDADSDCVEQYITNIKDGSIIGFGPFDFNNIKTVAIEVGGYVDEGKFEVALSYDGDAVGEIIIKNNGNEWKEYTINAEITNSINDIYFRYQGQSRLCFRKFTLE